MNLQQGFVVTAHALASLTAEPVSRHSWEQLAHGLVEEERIKQFARGIGSGVLSGLIRAGRFPRQPVEASGLVLGQSTRQLMAASRRASRSKSEKAGKDLPAIHALLGVAHLTKDSGLIDLVHRDYQTTHLMASGAVCPAANRGRQVTQSGRLVLHAMR